MPDQGAGWGGQRPGAAAARERLLDATEACVARMGLTSVGVAHVAREASVSRPTIYRYFKDRQALIHGVLERAARTLAQEVQDRIRFQPTAAAGAVEAIAFVVTRFREDPTLSRIWDAQVVDAQAVEGFTQSAAMALSRYAFEPLIDKAGWAPEEADEALELMLRILLSLLMAPDPRREPGALRAFLERRMVPGLFPTQRS